MSNSPKKIELLAPARDSRIGIAAVNHGADAVYIGAPRFSARQAAGNSLAEIGSLCRYAHRFNAKVYVALNTILKEEELTEAQRLVHQLYEEGADALIVQDMALLEMDLPPIALHASTQMDNRTPEKARFLESVGFSQIVLARELSCEQIAAVAAQVSVPLEVFVHGALCVSYSGQCYISECVSGRSANRGACAQYCRLPYTLTDGNGVVLQRDRHLLSLRDLNLSDSLEALLDAGVSSLKIEGRLKEMDYVKNCTAYYRQALDALFLKRGEYVAASAGKCRFSFDPSPQKSFNRRFSTYFFNGATREQSTPETPKSVGEFVGRVQRVQPKSFSVLGEVPLHNGDGLCYLDAQGNFTGFSVNRAEGVTVFPAQMPLTIAPQIALYRNRDVAFQKQLENPSSGQRKLGLDMTLSVKEEWLVLHLTDETGSRSESRLAFTPQTARTPQEAYVKQQLSKLGDTPFELHLLTIELPDALFIPASALGTLRREAVAELLAEKERQYLREGRLHPCAPLPYPQTSLSYLGNVANSLARRFYAKHGVTEMDDAYELGHPQGVALMFTRYCLKRELGYCSKERGDKRIPPEPWRLQYKEMQLRLHFDCARCGMQIFLENKQESRQSGSTS